MRFSWSYSHLMGGMYCSFLGRCLAGMFDLKCNWKINNIDFFHSFQVDNWMRFLFAYAEQPNKRRVKVTEIQWPTKTLWIRRKTFSTINLSMWNDWNGINFDFFYSGNSLISRHSNFRLESVSRQIQFDSLCQMRNVRLDEWVRHNGFVQWQPFLWFELWTRKKHIFFVMKRKKIKKKIKINS